MGFIGDVFWLCCGWIVVGGLAGGVARYIMGSKDAPFISDLILGVAGSIVGGIVLSLFMDTDNIGGGQAISFFIVSVVGASVLIFIGRTFFGTGKRRKR